MSRNDSFLYSGAHAGAAPRIKKSLEKDDKRRKLLPAEEVVMAELDKERIATEKQILSFIGVGTDKEQVKETLAALNLYDQSMTKLSNRFKNIIRKAAIKEDEDDE